MKKNELWPAIRFLIIASFLYVAWYLIYDLWLHPTRILDDFVITKIIFFTKHILVLLGYAINYDNRAVGIGTGCGVWIGDPCNGISLFALFTIFILAYPGKLLNKLFFIPAGILSIAILNIVRVISLVLIQYYHPTSLEFNHTYTFTYLMYGYIFFLWMIWVKKFGNLNQKLQETNDLT